MNESREVRRKRLMYVSKHRGMQETDLLLGRFADRHIDRLDDAQLDRFEALLQAGDNDLLNWISGKEAVPAVHDHDVMKMIKDYKNEI